MGWVGSLINAAVELFGKTVEPCVAGVIAGGGIEVVHEDVVGNRRRVFERAWTGTEFPFFGFDILV